MALLDPRFHRLIDVKNVDSCVQILIGKLLRLEDSKSFKEDDCNICPTLKGLDSTTPKNHLSSKYRKSSA